MSIEINIYQALQDQHWMRHALQLASQAEVLDEVPMGAVIVKDNELIGEGFNQPISGNDPPLTLK